MLYIDRFQRTWLCQVWQLVWLKVTKANPQVWLSVEQPFPVTCDDEVVGLPRKTSQFWLNLPPFLPPPPPPPPRPFSLYLQGSRPTVPWESSLCFLRAVCPLLSHRWPNLNPSPSYSLSLLSSSHYWQTRVLLLSVSLCLSPLGTSVWTRLSFHQNHRI